MGKSSELYGRVSGLSRQIGFGAGDHVAGSFTADFGAQRHLAGAPGARAVAEMEVENKRLFAKSSWEHLVS